jgi:hypothetical protein
VDTIGRGFDQTVRAANDVLYEAKPWVRRAWEQLRRKASPGTCLNCLPGDPPVRLLDHRMRHRARHRHVPRSLEDVGGLDTVWVLWAPDHLTVWSYARHEWINLFYNTMNPTRPTSGCEGRSRSPAPGGRTVFPDARGLHRRVTIPVPRVGRVDAGAECSPTCNFQTRRCDEDHDAFSQLAHASTYCVTSSDVSIRVDPAPWANLGSSAMSIHMP